MISPPDGSNIFPHRDNLAGAHVDVTACDVSQRRVHSQNMRATHDKFAAPRQLCRTSIR
jgi:hypothetical protein